MEMEKEEGQLGDLPEQPCRKRQESEEEGRGVWMKLPTDVLLLVFARLTAVDLIRAGAVCLSWRKALKTNGHLPPRTILPWLVIRDELMETATDDHRCRFVDPNTGNTCRIHLPGLHPKRLVGTSSDGFLVYEELPSRRLSMINPITKATIVFPPLPSPQSDCLRVVVVPTGSGYTLVVHRFSELFSASVDAGNLETWSRVSPILDHIQVYELHAFGEKLCGLLFEKEGGHYFFLFFTCDLDDLTDLNIWDFEFGPYLWSLADFGGSFPDHCRDECRGHCLENCCITNFYPLVLPNGDLIVVCEAFLISPPRPFAVKVYRMPADLHGEPAIVTSIGNYAVFLGHHDPVVLSTLDFPELKPSTVYFGYPSGLDDDDGAGWSSDKDLVVFDMEARSFPIPVKDCDFHGISSWFVPVF